MKRSFVASDLHLIPGEEVPPVAVKFAEMAKAEGARIIFAGDIFDRLPWGWRAWGTTAGVFTLNDFKRVFPKQNTIRVRGNHDPQDGLACWLERGNLILHGDKYTEWKILRHFAPQLIEFMVKYFPSQWYAFSRSRGWIPSRYRTDIPGKELDKYNKLVTQAWAFALMEAQKHNIRIIMGHTHHVAHLDTETGAEVWDCGNLRDGSFIRISQGTVISRGWVK